MGRKESDLSVVVCTKLSALHVEFLDTYARECYNKGLIQQPTTSHILRYIVTAHRKLVIDKENSEQPSNLVRTGYTQPITDACKIHTESAVSAPNVMQNPPTAKEMYYWAISLSKAVLPYFYLSCLAEKGELRNQ